jgi:hypothetical protein
MSNPSLTSVTFEGNNVQFQINAIDRVTVLPAFDGNFHDVYSGRGTYVRGSNGQWTKQ